MSEASIIKCQIYRSSRQEGMYLYVHPQTILNDLPSELLKSFGQLQPVMELELSPGRRLARENLSVVMKNLVTQGFHLQMPPDPLRPHLHYGD